MLNALQTPFPYRLRLEHEGAAGLSMQRKGRTLRFDPARPAREGDILVLTSPEPERLAHARAQGVSVVAPQPILDWLSPKDGHAPTVTIDGVTIEMIPHAPAPVRPGALLGKAQGVAVRPGAAARRVLARARAPRCDPQVTIVTFASGERLVHLNHALHADTPDDWLADVQARAAGAQWLVIGVLPGEGDAVLAALGGFDVEKVLFTDLVADTHRALGRPVELITPTADQAIARGVEGYVFVSQASFRFE